VSNLGAPYTIQRSGAGSADRFFAELDDASGGGGFDLRTELLGAKVKAGAALSHTERTFSSRRFRFEVDDPALETLPPEELFRPDNLGSGVHAEEVTRFSDGYTASRDLYAGYAMVDAVPLASLRLVGGARYERARQAVHIGTPYSLAPSEQDVGRIDDDVLPAVSAVYNLAEGLDLRAAYARTVARPSFRELAPALYYDFARGRTASGNPELRTTHIQNADLRVERFFGSTDLVGASVFYKSFADPIEATFKDQNGDSLSYVNTPSANAIGAELEARFNLGRVAEALQWLYVGGNVSLVRSRIELDGGTGRSTTEGTSRSRPLQGQSPYVANLEVGARVAESELNVLYNVAGARLSEVGVGGAPDAYELPFHRLDATFSQALEQGFRLKVSATNLLNQRVRFAREDVVILGYRPGVALSAAIEWSLN
jgi:TonB-dependent receptor